jgi:adenosylcobinamide-phosphate synthase
MINTIIILAIALALDLALGDPPTAWHPVGWMGRLIGMLVRGGKGLSPAPQLIYGIGVVLVTAAVFVTPVYFLLLYLKGLNWIAWVIGAALLLKPTFTLRGLWRTALKIRDLLAAEKLAEARFELRALVGRDTRSLDKGHLVSATVESIAENSCDSFFAPLFYFVFLGVPGAIAYRVINTLDAMIGHHGEFEYLGKAAARLDTVVNFIPARLAALFILLASWIYRSRARAAWRIMLRDARKTESPNAGWTMSALAGALGVRLEKIGYYRLGDEDQPLTAASIDTTLKIVLTAAALWAAVLLIAEVIWYVKA